MTTTASSSGDVMVFGRGISGNQAALDFAPFGYKVYLAERAPTNDGIVVKLWRMREWQKQIWVMTMEAWNEAQDAVQEMRRVSGKYGAVRSDG